MICGCDPGSAGAIAWLSNDGHLIAVEDLPVGKIKVGKTLRSRLLAVALRDMLEARRPDAVWMEETHANGKNGAIGNYQLGNCAGLIEGVCAGLGIPLHLVKPSEWQRHYGRGADKGRSRADAMRLWPGAAASFARVRDDGRAEAALIGRYGATVRGMRVAA